MSVPPSQETYLTKDTPANRTELEEKFQRIAREVIKKFKGSTEALTEELIRKYIEAVPAAAFDPLQPFDEGILFYHGNVDEGEVSEFQHDLTRAHLNLDKDVPITLNLSSVGGSVFAGLALMSTISSLQREGRIVNAHIQGVAMSMGAIIVQACNKRTMESSSKFMLHEISYGMRGSTADHEEEREFTAKLQNSLYEYCSRRTGRPVSYYQQKTRKANWYLDASECLAEGLIDEVVSLPALSCVAPTTPDVIKALVETAPRPRRKAPAKVAK
jgi:ATP-dependent protease ClpP protease subunit